MMIDTDALLEPVSADKPGGDDLEYDPAFVELEDAARGKEERQVGDLIEAAEEPDWKDVGQRAAGLLARSKDLRAAVYLTRAALNIDGLAGLRDGLELIRRLLERYWDELHPQLDPDDDYDPVMRVNILAELTDPDAFLAKVRLAPLVQSRTFGRFSMRDIAIARGELSPVGDDDAPDMAQIEAAFSEADVDALRNILHAIDEASSALTTIESTVTERVGVENSASFSTLSDVLRDASHIVAEKLELKGVSAGGDADGEAGEGDSDTDGPAKGYSGEIRSREDVIVALERIAEYYRRYEPSSPLPLLVHRAKSLVHGDFMDILRNVAPDAVAQAEFLAGPGLEAEDE